METKEMIATLKNQLLVLDNRFKEMSVEAADIYKQLTELEKSMPEISVDSWLSPEETARHFSISRQTVDRRLKEMERLGSRYTGCIIREPKCVRVQLRAFEDYEKYRELLAGERTRKIVPAYFRAI